MTKDQADSVAHTLLDKGKMTRQWYCGPTQEWYVDVYLYPPGRFTHHPSAWSRVDKDGCVVTRTNHGSQLSPSF